jgi:hypothetical protein
MSSYRIAPIDTAPSATHAVLDHVCLAAILRELQTETREIGIPEKLNPACGLEGVDRTFRNSKFPHWQVAPFVPPDKHLVSTVAETKGMPKNRDAWKFLKLLANGM